MIGSILTSGLPGLLAGVRPSSSFGGLTSASFGFTKFVHNRIHVLLHVGIPKWARTPKRPNNGDSHSPEAAQSQDDRLSILIFQASP